MLLRFTPRSCVPILTVSWERGRPPQAHIMHSDRLNVVDLEATCWKGPPPEGMEQEIIEIGICTVDTDDDAIVDQESILIPPQVGYISDYCTELTSLTSEQLERKGEALVDACERLQREYKSSKYPWASWGDWDRFQFREECDRKNIEYPFSRTHINLKVLHAMHRGLRNAKSLARALDHEGFDFKGQPHRGIDDAKNAARIACTLMSDDS